MINLLAQTVVDSVISDLLKSVSKGLEWANSVVIGITAAMLAISLIKFLFER